MSVELQRGPDKSLTYEVWQRIEWANGAVTDWRPREIGYSNIEAARNLIAVLPVRIPEYMNLPGGMITYRIRQAIKILEWLE